MALLATRPQFLADTRIHRRLRIDESPQIERIAQNRIPPLTTSTSPDT